MWTFHHDQKNFPKMALIRPARKQNSVLFSKQELLGFRLVSVRDSIESDTFYAGFTVKLIRRLSVNLMYHVFSMKTLDNLQTRFTIKNLNKMYHSPDCLRTVSIYSLHTVSLLTILVNKPCFLQKILRQIA